MNELSDFQKSQLDISTDSFGDDRCELEHLKSGHCAYVPFIQGCFELLSFLVDSNKLSIDYSDFEYFFCVLA